MNIIKRELKSSLVNIAVWSLAFVFLAYAGIIKFDSILGSGPGVVDLLNRFPRIILALFNMADIDVTHLADYFSIIASYLMVMVASQGMFLGIRLFAKEEQDKTADFLLTKPRSRAVIFGQKLASGILIVLILQVILFVANWAALQSHLPEAKAMLVNYSLAFLLIHLAFLALGVCLTNAFSRKRAETVGLGVLLISYFVPVLTNLSEKLYSLKNYFPFNTFLHRSMEEVGGAPVLKLFILLAIALSLSLMGLKRFQKKDIII